MGLDYFYSEEEITYTCLIICNSLSILACLFVIFIYVTAADLRVYAFKLVAYLAVSDLFKSASMLFPTYSLGSNDVFCQSQSIVYEFFTFLSFLLTLVMSVSLYACVVKNCEKIESFHVVSMGTVGSLAVISTAVGAFWGVYGRANYWCWIKIEETMWRYLLFYGPLWLVNIVNLIIYYKVIKTLAFTSSPLKRLRIYPIILILCYIPGTIFRTIEAFQITPPFPLILSTCIGDGLLGLFNSLCYGYTEPVKNFLISKFCHNKTHSAQELLPSRDL